MHEGSGTTHGNAFLGSALTRRQMLRRLLAAGAVPPLSAILAACSGDDGGTTATGSASVTGEPVTGGTLRLGTAGAAVTLDPIKSVAASDIVVLGQLYSRLTRRSLDGKEVLPGLAESWESSEDGITWTFNLREAAFSDGSPITGEDVVFSYLRLRDQKDSAYGGAFQVIEDIKAPDERTVQFTLTGPAAPFLGSTEQFNAGIVPKAVVEEVGDDRFSKNPVTSGAWQLAEWAQGDRLVLERNPNYWRDGLPYLDGVELITVSKDTTRVSKLEAGEVDVVDGVPWAKIEEFLQVGQYQVPLEPSSVIYIVLINHKDPNLAAVDVRRAMAMAIDREGITQAVTFGHATPANSLLPNTVEYYDPSVAPPAYAPDEARALLESAGAVGTAVTFMVGTGDSEGAQATQLMQDQLNSVGFEVSIEEVDANTWWDKLIGADYGATFNWWYNEVPDPDPAVRWALCGECGNESFYTYYNNEQVNELTEEAVFETDPAARGELYSQIQQIAVEEVAQVPIWYQPYQHAYQPNVRNLHMNPAIQWNWDEAWLEGSAS
jgi:peptide/nickel transport system substrate-binding protein